MVVAATFIVFSIVVGLYAGNRVVELAHAAIHKVKAKLTWGGIANWVVELFAEI